jgi:hypothetical protein
MIFRSGEGRGDYRSTLDLILSHLTIGQNLDRVHGLAFVQISGQSLGQNLRVAGGGTGSMSMCVLR